VVSGDKPGMLAALLEGEDVGTLFACGGDRQSRRQHWISEVLHPAGRIMVDAGAAQALLEHGASLLPVGVHSIEGVFDKGECVEIIADGKVIARGLCNYSTEEMRRLAGVASEDIERVLGYRDFSSLVHRDNLVLLNDKEKAG